MLLTIKVLTILYMNVLTEFFLPLRNARQNSWQMSFGILGSYTQILCVSARVCLHDFKFPSSFSRNNGLVQIKQFQDYWYNHKLKWDPELSVHRKACLTLSVFEVINDAAALWEKGMSIIIWSHRREKPFLIMVFEATQVIWVQAIRGEKKLKNVRQI